MSELSKKNVVDPATLNPAHSAGSDLPASYRELLDANPYVNYDYYKSPWQDFLSGLGLRTGSDAYREQMQVQAAEFDSQIKMMNFQNQYNSELAKSQRMRSAGINPDLAGLGDASESVAPPEDGNPPVPPTDDVESVGAFANQIMSCFATAVGISKDLGALSSVTLGNEKQRLENAAGLYSLANEAILRGTHRSDFDDPVNFASKVNGRVREIAQQMFPYGSRRYKRFIRSVEGSLGGLPTEKDQLKAWFDTMEGRKAGYGTRYSSDYSDSNEVLKSIATVLGKFKLDERRYQAESDKWKAFNGLEYNELFDGQQAAMADNATNEGREAEGEATKNYYDNVSQLDKLYKELTSSVQKHADNGNVVAQCFLALFSVLRLQLLKI